MGVEVRSLIDPTGIGVVLGVVDQQVALLRTRRWPISKWREHFIREMHLEKVAETSCVDLRGAG